MFKAVRGNDRFIGAVSDGQVGGLTNHLPSRLFARMIPEFTTHLSSPHRLRRKDAIVEASEKGIDGQTAGISKYFGWSANLKSLSADQLSVRPDLAPPFVSLPMGAQNVASGWRQYDSCCVTN